MPTSKDIINLTVNFGEPSIVGATFDVPLIIAPHVYFRDRVRTYTDIDGVGEDIPSNDAIYKMAQAAFTQESLEGKTIGLLKIGTRKVDVIPVSIYNPADSGDVLTVILTDITHPPKITVNSTVITGTVGSSDIAAAGNLVSLINASAEPVTAVDLLDGSFTVTADVADTPFNMAVAEELDFVSALHYVKTVESKYATTSASTSTADNIAALIASANGVAGGVPNYVDITAPGGGFYTCTRATYTGLIDVIVNAQSARIVPGTSAGRGDNFMLAPAVSETITETISAIRDVDDNWFAIASLDATDSALLEIAGVIQPLAKIYAAASEESTILDVVTNDILSQLGALNYDQTFLDFMTDASGYGDIRMLAEGLPNTPGTRTWFGKDRVGQIAEDITTTKELNLKGKNGNAYLVIKDVSEARTFYGKMVDGTFIDIVHFKFYLENTLSVGLLSYVLGNPGIPYTDEGLNEFEAVITDLLKPFIETDGSLAPILSDTKRRTVIITIPSAADQTQADRDARIVRNIKTRVQYGGFAHEFDVTIDVAI